MFLVLHTFKPPIEPMEFDTRIESTFILKVAPPIQIKLKYDLLSSEVEKKRKRKGAWDNME